MRIPLLDKYHDCYEDARSAIFEIIIGDRATDGASIKDAYEKVKSCADTYMCCVRLSIQPSRRGNIIDRTEKEMADIESKLRKHGLSYTNDEISECSKIALRENERNISRLSEEVNSRLSQTIKIANSQSSTISRIVERTVKGYDIISECNSKLSSINSLM